jgi:hypothetical protein
MTEAGALAPPCPSADFSALAVTPVMDDDLRAGPSVVASDVLLLASDEFLLVSDVLPVA